MRTRKSYRRRAWAQRIALVLLLAVVATLVIARIWAEPVAGEVSTTPEVAPQETAVLRPEPTYVVEAIPTPEPTPMVVARYADVTMTEAERDELAAIIYLEARGEPAEGQQAVAEVVLNRVVSPDFPDSVSEVLHQGEGTAVPQFSTIGLLSAAEPGQAQYDAIDAALVSIQDGGMTATVKQDGDAMGYANVRIAVNYLQTGTWLDGLDYTLAEDGYSVRIPYAKITADEVE